jgi:hypothetical protein
MKQLKYYIYGMISVIFILPILNQLLEVITLWIEAWKINPNTRILKYQKDTTILREFIQPQEEMAEYEVKYLDEDDD